MSAPPADFSEEERRRIRRDLLRWYDRERRDLPWRKRPTPYTAWVAEMMLQQTQAAAAVDYYRRFLRRFPSLKALAEADEQEVLKLWEGLGYYARARNMLRAARLIRERYAGRFPRTREGLMSLPGVGRYCAGAILSIAMGQRAAAVDGNVIRILARLLAAREDPRRAAGKEFFWRAAEPLVPSDRPGDFNQALMDLGALVCRPRAPACERCPLAWACRARAEGVQQELPVKARRPAPPHYQVGVGVVWRGEKVLIGRRPSEGLLGGLWEFPGGKQQPGESMAECVAREVKEETGVDVAVGPRALLVRHAYSHFRVTLHFYHCVHERGRARAVGCAACRWVKPEELKRYAFPAGSARAVEAVASGAWGPDGPA